MLVLCATLCLILSTDHSLYSHWTGELSSSRVERHRRQPGPESVLVVEQRSLTLELNVPRTCLVHCSMSIKVEVFVSDDAVARDS